jgi:hypothetical protein
MGSRPGGVVTPLSASMINFLQPISIGNGIRALWSPAAGTVRTRLLRKLTDDFSGPTDSNAALLYEGDERSFLDVQTLNNGTVYYYRTYDFNGTTWTASPTASATPAETAGVGGPDPLTLVRDRLAAGLKAEVAAGRLRHDTGAIPCLTAPPTFEQTKFPVVTVHLRNDAPAVRGVGETLAADAFDADADLWTASEGWLSSVQLDIVGWVVGNADTRIALRKAIKKILVGNLSVFDAAGMVQIEFSQSDIEDFESYNAPVYQTMCSFSCLSPFVVSATEGAVDDVTVDAQAA